MAHARPTPPRDDGWRQDILKGAIWGASFTILILISYGILTAIWISLCLGLLFTIHFRQERRRMEARSGGPHSGREGITPGPYSDPAPGDR